MRLESQAGPKDKAPFQQGPHPRTEGPQLEGSKTWDVNRLAFCRVPLAVLGGRSLGGVRLEAGRQVMRVLPSPGRRVELQ